MNSDGVRNYCGAQVALEVLSVTPTGTLTALRSGASPKTMAQLNEIAKVKSKTRESSTNGISTPDQAASARLPEIANIQPKAVPPETRRNLSVSICRNRRLRPAPRALRTENSRARVALRATRSVDTLAQAIARTSPTMAKRIWMGF